MLPPRSPCNTHLRHKPRPCLPAIRGAVDSSMAWALTPAPAERWSPAAAPQCHRRRYTPAQWVPRR